MIVTLWHPVFASTSIKVPEADVAKWLSMGWRATPADGSPPDPGTGTPTPGVMSIAGLSGVISSAQLAAVALAGLPGGTGLLSRLPDGTLTMVTPEDVDLVALVDANAG